MEEKKTFKQKLADKWTSVKKFCEDHPDVVLTLVGGIASIAGAGLRVYANKSEYEDYLYTTVDNKIYKLPAKEMKTADKLQSPKK